MSANGTEFITTATPPSLESFLEQDSVPVRISSAYLKKLDVIYQPTTHDRGILDHFKKLVDSRLQSGNQSEKQKALRSLDELSRRHDELKDLLVHHIAEFAPASGTRKLSLGHVVNEHHDQVTVEITLSQPDSGTLKAVMPLNVTVSYNNIAGTVFIDGPVSAVKNFLSELFFIPNQQFQTDMSLEIIASDGLYTHSEAIGLQFDNNRGYSILTADTMSSGTAQLPDTGADTLLESVSLQSITPLDVSVGPESVQQVLPDSMANLHNGYTSVRGPIEDNRPIEENTNDPPPEQGSPDPPTGQATQDTPLPQPPDGSSTSAPAPVNMAPAASADSYITQLNQPVTLDESNGLTGVIDNDSDGNGDALTISSIDALSANGGTIVDNGDDTYTYTPAPSYTGEDSFSYTINDGNGGTDSATVTITVNTAPVSADDAYGTTFEASLIINATNGTDGLMDNDTDVNAHTLSIQTIDAVSTNGGSIVDNGDNTYTYTPAAGYVGADSFSYTVSDGFGGSDTATVNITVNNQSPAAANDSYSTSSNTAITLDESNGLNGLIDNDTDPDGQTLSISAIDTNSANGGTIVDNGDGTYTYTPAAGYVGSDSFDYTITDGFGGSDTATATITVPNQTPIGSDDSYITNTNIPLTFDDTNGSTGLLDNDSDSDGHTLSIQSIDTASANGGSIVDNGDGTYTYTPPALYSGNDSFRYVVSDGNGGTDTATVNFTISNAVSLTSATNDALLGNAAVNNFSGSGSNWHTTDIIRGGGNQDTLVINTDAASIDLAGATGVESIENIQLNADAAHEIIFSNDYFTRGTGVDTAYVAVSTTAITENVRIDASAVSASDHNYFITGGGADDTLRGGAGEDTITSGTGMDSINAGGGDDRIVLEWAATASGILPTSGLVSHLDASLTGSITTHPGTVTEWDDQSTANNDASNFIGTVQSGSQMINGLNALEFDGSSILEIGDSNDINLNTQDARSYFLSFETGADVTTRQMVYEQGGASNGFNIYIDNGMLYLGAWRSSGGSFDYYYSTAITANTTYSAGLVFDYITNNRVSAHVNGTEIGSDSLTQDQSAHSGNIAIGGISNDTRYHDTNFNGDGNAFTGLIGEFTNYDAALSSASINAINGYLLSKWHGLGSGDTIFGGNGEDTLEITSGDTFLTTLDGADIQSIEYFDLTGLDDSHVLSFEDGYFASGLHTSFVTVDGTANSTGFTVDGSALSSGNDLYILPGDGDDTIHGGDGSDTIDYSASSSAIDMNLGAGTATGMGTDSLTGIDWVIGSNLDDTLGGSTDSETLRGGYGDDTLYGEAAYSGTFTSTNLVIHYDASDTSIINGHPGNVIDIDDLSSANNDAFDDNGVVRSGDDQINGLNALTFDGNSMLEINNSGDINSNSQNDRSIFVAFQTDNDITSRQMIYEQGGSVNGYSIYIESGELIFGTWKAGGSDIDIYHTQSIAANTTYVGGLIYDQPGSGSVRSYLNGSEIDETATSEVQSRHTGSIGLGGINQNTLIENGSSPGTGDYFDGLIGEFLNYDGALTNTQAIDLSGYLMDKWMSIGGDDSLDGGSGDDELHGSYGDDTLIGGIGNDRFVFSDDSGQDVITDFDAPGAGAGDVIEILSNINGSAISDFVSLQASISANGGNALIDLDPSNPGSHTIELTGIDHTLLTADDFVFV
jgi:hypothetical protein